MKITHRTQCNNIKNSTVQTNNIIICLYCTVFYIITLSSMSYFHNQKQKISLQIHNTANNNKKI